MGYHGDNNLTAANALGIPAGLVAQRRDELLLNGFCGNQASLDAAARSYTEQTVPNTAELLKVDNSINATDSPVILDPVFLEQSPTRRSSRVSDPGMLFSDKEKTHTNKPASIDLTQLLKEAVTEAEQKYMGYCKNGTNRRSSPGWFSTLRHRTTGVVKSEQLGEEFKSFETSELILEQMHSFFHDPKTKYNNHSFSSYLLDELNILLTKHSYAGAKPENLVSYDTNVWAVIFGQLQQLAMRDEKANVMVIG